MSILYYRKRANLTQKELGMKIDVADSAVSQWERGKARPLKKHARRMCRLFGCTEEELLSSDTLREEAHNAAYPS